MSRSFGDFDFSEMVGLGYQIDFFFVTDWEEAGVLSNKDSYISDLFWDEFVEVEMVRGSC